MESRLDPSIHPTPKLHPAASPSASACFSKPVAQLHLPKPPQLHLSCLPLAYFLDKPLPCLALSCLLETTITRQAAQTATAPATAEREPHLPETSKDADSANTHWPYNLSLKTVQGRKPR